MGSIRHLCPLGQGGSGQEEGTLPVFVACVGRQQPLDQRGGLGPRQVGQGQGDHPGPLRVQQVWGETLPQPRGIVRIRFGQGPRRAVLLEGEVAEGQPLLPRQAVDVQQPRSSPEAQHFRSQ